MSIIMYNSFSVSIFSLDSRSSLSAGSELCVAGDEVLVIEFRYFYGVGVHD